MKHFIKKLVMLALTIVGLAAPINAVFYFGAGFGPRYRARHYWGNYGYPYRRYYWYRPYWYHRHYWW